MLESVWKLPLVNFGFLLFSTGDSWADSSSDEGSFGCILFFFFGDFGLDGDFLFGDVGLGGDFFFGLGDTCNVDWSDWKLSFRVGDAFWPKLDSNGGIDPLLGDSWKDEFWDGSGLSDLRFLPFLFGFSII